MNIITDLNKLNITGEVVVGAMIRGTGLRSGVPDGDLDAFRAQNLLVGGEGGLLAGWERLSATVARETLLVVGLAQNGSHLKIRVKKSTDMSTVITV